MHVLYADEAERLERGGREGGHPCEGCRNPKCPTQNLHSSWVVRVPQPKKNRRRPGLKTEILQANKHLSIFTATDAGRAQPGDGVSGAQRRLRVDRAREADLRGQWGRFWSCNVGMNVIRREFEARVLLCGPGGSA